LQRRGNLRLQRHRAVHCYQFGGADRVLRRRRRRRHACRQLVGARRIYRYADYGTWRTTLGNPATLAVTTDIRMRTHTALFGLAYTFMGFQQ